LHTFVSGLFLKAIMGITKKQLDLIVCGIILIATLPLNPFFCGNQNTYFLKGFYQAGYLQEDWLAGCISTATEFDAIVAFILKYFPKYYALFFQMLFAGFYAVFIYFLYRIIAYFTTRTKAILAILLTSLLFFSETFYYLFFFTKIPPSLAYIPYTGVAGFSLINYLQPSTFGILLIPAIYFYLLRKYLLTSFLVLVTCLFHTTYMLLGGLMLLLVIYELFIEKNWKALGKILLVIIPFSIIIFLQLLPFINADVVIALEGKRILIEERSPHHHVVSKWVSENKSDWIRIVILLVAGFIFPNRLKKLFLFTAGVALTLTIIQYLTNNATLSLASPWRMASIWMPVCSSFLILWILEKYHSANNHKYWVALASILFFMAMYIKWFSKDNHLTLPKLAAIENLEGTLLIPPKGDWGERSENVRLNYLKPVFVDEKSHPYDPESVIQWKERMDLAKQFYATPNQKTLDAILAKQKINAIIWPEELAYKPVITHLSVIKSNGFYIYKIS
jgi:hypothetical protein